ncbi:hypothetical protein CP532_0712 [Ophiocordyceps camponoti-leonardi (nom. inval.)]|nr:hypothetical protein CP532_0712 [Ophiocordyceps camponoti-leonardi (nom. inval.)]
MGADAADHHTLTLESEPLPYDLKGWELLLSTQRRENGDDGGWIIFEAISQRGLLGLIDLSEANVLRDEIVAVALSSDERTAKLIEVAHQLYDDSGYLWPHLYLKIMYFTIEHARFREAARWHFCLARPFCTGAEVFGSLIAAFACDPSPEMQNGLRSLYIVSSKRGLYDFIIPTLFSSGKSELARRWRRTLIMFNDFPTTAESLPFLKFLFSYYPTIELTEEEIAVARLVSHTASRRDDDDKTGQSLATSHDAPKSQGHFSDSVVAKWLASSWASVEFAVNFVHRLGLRKLGPRSLQSLALREKDAQAVASRLEQIERLGIGVSTTAYCKVLVFFAKHGEDDLLASLLNCDVHPDEFEDVNLRYRLRSASIEAEDTERTRLWEGVEQALEQLESSRKVHALQNIDLCLLSMSEVSRILDQIEAAKLSVTQHQATNLLSLVTDGISQHPSEWYVHLQTSGISARSHLDNAVAVIRRIAHHDVAVPISHWKLLLLNLGRLGFFDELERMCLELVKKYSPASQNMVPVHYEDWPRPPTARVTAKKAKKPSSISTEPEDTASGGLKALNARDKGWNGESEHHGGLEDKSVRAGARPPAALYRTPEKNYLPTDFPFTHREHPLQKLFDPRLQQSIVRWGFDQTLKIPPQSPSLLCMNSAGIRRFDIACGVRLLALLRDQGVLIDSQIVLSTVLKRIGVSEVPGRKIHRARDENELQLRLMKRLADEAWGSELLPDPKRLRDEIDRLKPETEERYRVTIVKHLERL